MKEKCGCLEDCTFPLRCPASTSALGGPRCPADRGAKKSLPVSAAGASAVFSLLTAPAVTPLDLILTQQGHHKGRMMVMISTAQM